MTLVLALLLASCVGGASVTRTPKGGYHATSGYTLLGEQEGVIAYVKTREGDEIRFMAKRQDGSKVVSKWLDWWGAGKLAALAAGTQEAQIAADKDVAVGAQGVETFKEGEQTKRVLGTTLNPNLPPH